MKKFLKEYAEAFRHGMIRPGFKPGRWLAFTVLVLLGVASWVTGVVFLSLGYLPGVTLFICGFTFAFTSMTVVFSASTSEHYKETQRIYARMKNLTY